MMSSWSQGVPLAKICSQVSGAKSCTQLSKKDWVVVVGAVVVVVGEAVDAEGVLMATRAQVKQQKSLRGKIAH